MAASTASRGEPPRKRLRGKTSGVPLPRPPLEAQATSATHATRSCSSSTLPDALASVRGSSAEVLQPRVTAALAAAKCTRAAGSPGSSSTASAGGLAVAARSPPSVGCHADLPGGVSATVATVATPSRAATAAAQQGAAFLRLSPACAPLLSAGQLVYLDRPELIVGRLPTCDVVLDSPQAPQMISRCHGSLRRIAGDRSRGGDVYWIIRDSRSMNGILVNGERIAADAEGRRLYPGDVVTFGRRLAPPVFEFVFEHPCRASPEKELSQAQEQRRVIRAQQQQQPNQLGVAELRNELVCCVCRDWMVDAATTECSHSFCWSCIDTWLLEKKFECPVCREEVTREPLRTRTVDAIVQKSVGLLPSEDQTAYRERVAAAEAAREAAKTRLVALEAEVAGGAAGSRAGKAFPLIHAQWKKREREAFQQAAATHSGDAHEMYCRFHGLTVQWVHSADEDQLNQALHNLQLQKFVSCSEDRIRQRLLMFLRYG
eukprot:TRINITY_DN16763_c0_g1_i3.p1 TRINITY_DN16763_c0_g1~~TRINITY_DN16763_c0_g1_i3.p1  ORF type:complete len:488 (-),score=105.69 TRINITY_DN16763_c0_g1_i3:69-1532(-)